MAHCTPAQAQHVYSAIIISTYCSGCCEILSLSFHEALIKWITTNPMSFIRHYDYGGLGSERSSSKTIQVDSRYFQSAGWRAEDGGAGGDVPRAPGQGRLLHAAEEAAG